MKKILFVYTKCNLGGTEMVLLNIIKNLNNEYDLNFLAEDKGDFEEDFRKHGVKFKYIPFKDSVQILEYFNNENFDVIHINTCPNMGQILKLAYRAGIKKRIAHSHNARTDLPKYYKFLKIIKSYSTEKYANIYLACSTEAAKWLFPLKYKKAIILKNGVNVDIFRYNENTRDNIRSNLRINQNDIVIGTVGRLSIEKNQILLLKVMEKLIKKNKNYRLILIGEGPEKNNLLEYIKNNDLEKYVLLLGKIINVNEYLNAFDLFCLPSRAEGLGLAIIEAQYNGLPSIASSGVPDEADIGENLFKKIDFDTNTWVTALENIKKDRKIKITSNKYNIKDIVKIVEKVYEGDN